jgi:hypothetical protein
MPDLEAMRAGREAQAARRAARHHEQVTTYRAWLAAERRALHHWRAMADAYGVRSAEAQRAREEYRAVGPIPELPPPGPHWDHEAA